MIAPYIFEPITQYHANPAWGSSAAKRALISPQAAHDAKRGVGKKDSAGFAFGNAWDAWWTERARCVIRPGDFDGRTKEGKAWLAALAADALALTPADARVIELATSRMHALNRELLNDQGLIRQAVFRGTMDGVAAQCRPDLMRVELPDIELFDLKTTSKPLEQIQRQVVSYGYHFQAAWYRRLVAQSYQLEREAVGFCLVVTETESPYRTERIILDSDFMRLGDQMVDQALHIIRRATETGDWNQYPPYMRAIGPPRWAINHEEGF